MWFCNCWGLPAPFWRKCPKTCVPAFTALKRNPGVLRRLLVPLESLPTSFPIPDLGPGKKVIQFRKKAADPTACPISAGPQVLGNDFVERPVCPFLISPAAQSPPQQFIFFLHTNVAKESEGPPHGEVFSGPPTFFRPAFPSAVGPPWASGRRSLGSAKNRSAKKNPMQGGTPLLKFVMTNWLAKKRSARTTTSEKVPEKKTFNSTAIHGHTARARPWPEIYSTAGKETGGTKKYLGPSPPSETPVR